MPSGFITSADADMSDEVFSEFVLEHSADDPARLILNRSKWPDVDVNAAVTAIECRRKIRTKLPEWYAEAGIVYPDRICAEQSSSSATAEYKASVAAGIISGALSGGRIADLTGGLGVDSLAFSRVASRVLYNEMNPERAAAARHNFPLLGADNVEVMSHCVMPGTRNSDVMSDLSLPLHRVRSSWNRTSDVEPDLDASGSIETSSQDADVFWASLREFRPDLVYMDPARRSSTGGKVFLLEDCSPDVLTLLTEIFSIVPDLLLKLSPMADISMLVRRLEEHGAGVKEVHVVAAAGECKELLLWVRPAPEQDTSLIVNENGHIMCFPSSAFGRDSAPGQAVEEYAPLFLENLGQVGSMRYLFEPGKALSKAGLFNAVCTMFSGRSSASGGNLSPLPLFKAGRSTHLYFLENDCFSEPCPDKSAVIGCRPDNIASIKDFGKVFRILEAVPLDKQSIKAFSKRYPKAEVSARNVPMSSDGLRKKLKVSSGGDVHIFGLRIDFLSAPSASYLIAATRG